MSLRIIKTQTLLAKHKHQLVCIYCVVGKCLVAVPSDREGYSFTHSILSFTKNLHNKVFPDRKTAGVQQTHAKQGTTFTDAGDNENNAFLYANNLR